MASGQRPDTGSLGDLLRHAPQRFELLQALQILEREAPHLPPLGTSNDPQQEVVRVRGPLLPVFSPHQINSLEWVPQAPEPGDDASAPPDPRQPVSSSARLTLHTTVFGLGGPDGPLPYAYQDWLQQRARLKDNATLAFLDMFQHRLLSLLYRAQQKQRIALPYQAAERSPVYRQLQALCGLSAQPSGIPTTVRERALISRAGLLANGRRSLAGLQSLLTHHFKMRVRIEGFQGGWRKIPATRQTVLGRSGRNQTLGLSALCGSQVWDQNQSVLIHIGPLEPSHADSFMPHREAHRQLGALVTAYLAADLHGRLRIYTRESTVLHLQHEQGDQPGLGLGTRLNREARHGAFSIDVNLGNEEA